jgi:putative flippase GtrA
MADAPHPLVVEMFRILRFGLAGLANTLVGGAAILALQLGFGVNAHLANAGGYAVGMIMGFFLSRSFVFGSSDRSSGVALRYGAAIAGAFGLNQFVLAALAGYMTSPGRVALAQGVAVATYTATLFLLSRFWVFAPREATLAH